MDVKENRDEMKREEGVRSGENLKTVTAGADRRQVRLCFRCGEDDRRNPQRQSEVDFTP